MIASYYLWKWADNGLPGKPNEVFADLLSGAMPPALQRFDARPLLQRIDALIAGGRIKAAEWEWEVHPAGEAANANFVFLRCPAIPRFGPEREQFVALTLPSDVSGYDEQSGGLIECLLPKQNCFTFGETPDESVCDITVEELPVLLRQVRPAQANPHASLTDRHNHFVQCYARKGGYTVEWRTNFSLTDLSAYDQWCAGDPDHPKRHLPPRIVKSLRYIKSRNCNTREKAYLHENLRFADVLRIFEAFLRGEPRPPQYAWRSIKPELEAAEQGKKGNPS